MGVTWPDPDWEDDLNSRDCVCVRTERDAEQDE